VGSGKPVSMRLIATCNSCVGVFMSVILEETPSNVK
jgi:hypothetical protein